MADEAQLGNMVGLANPYALCLGHFIWAPLAMCGDAASKRCAV